jgi:hypothetical protein
MVSVDRGVCVERGGSKSQTSGGGARKTSGKGRNGKSVEIGKEGANFECMRTRVVALLQTLEMKITSLSRGTCGLTI